MNFETYKNEEPSFQDTQVQQCSIDLTLSTEFWKQKKIRYPIDLRQNKLTELIPERHWKKLVLKKDESIIIRPNEFIFGHTHEKFTIPLKFAGKVNTRSSFARLGIETNSSTDYLSPGWRGYVPLEIINKSRNAYKLYPHLGIVQVLLVPLSSESEPDVVLSQANIHQDDGGPSLWWREKLYRQYEKRENITDDVANKLFTMDELGLYRFEKFFQRLKTAELDNGEDILQRFSKRERLLSILQNLIKWTSSLLFITFLGINANAVFGQNYTPFFWIRLSITILLLVPTIYLMFIKKEVKYYDEF